MILVGVSARTAGILGYSCQSYFLLIKLNLLDIASLYGGHLVLCVYLAAELSDATVGRVCISLGHFVALAGPGSSSASQISLDPRHNG